MDSSYSVDVENSVSGINRFYLHASENDILAIPKDKLRNLSIYPVNNSSIYIQGLESEKATFELFDVLGKQIIKENFKVENSNYFPLPISLQAGIYFVKVSTGTTIVVKEIVLY